MNWIQSTVYVYPTQMSERGDLSRTDMRHANDTGGYEATRLSIKYQLRGN